MRVTIDPNELSAVARTLEQCSVEAADIGSQLASCLCCVMPPAIAGEVNRLVGQVDSVLDITALRFHHQSVDLLKRAVIAAFDSLAAATGSTRELVAAQYGVNLVSIGGAAPAPQTTTSNVSLAQQVHNDLLAGRRSPINEAARAINERTIGIPSSMQAVLNSPNLVGPYLEPSREDIRIKVERTQGRPVAFETQAEKKWYAPETYG